jgi:rubrerythrin
MGNVWDVREFAVEDLYEMAAIVEQSGFDFYARLIARASDPRVANELKYLRDEEASHKAFFLDQLRARGGAPRGAVSPKLHELLDREFIKPMDRLFASGDIANTEKTLSFGCALEVKTMELYEAMKPSVGPSQAVDLDRIIAQEESHRRKLELIKAF